MDRPIHCTVFIHPTCNYAFVCSLPAARLSVEIYITPFMQLYLEQLACRVKVQKFDSVFCSKPLQNKQQHIIAVTVQRAVRIFDPIIHFCQMVKSENIERCAV